MMMPSIVSVVHALMILAILCDPSRAQDQQCDPGPGFVEYLSGATADDFIVTTQESLLLLPSCSFPCDGEVSLMTMSVQFKRGSYYSLETSLKLFLYRSNGSQYVVSDIGVKVNLTSISNYRTNTTIPQRNVYLSDSTQNLNLTVRVRPIRVKAGDFLGISFPRRIDSIVIEAIPLVWRQNMASPHLSLTSTGCWSAGGPGQCYSVVGQGSPLIVGDYVPDSVSSSPSSTPTLSVPVIPRASGSTVSTGAVALGILFAVSAIALIVVLLAGVGYVLHNRVYKRREYEISAFSTQRGAREEDAYVTINRVNDHVIYESADGPPTVSNPLYSQLDNSVKQDVCIYSEAEDIQQSIRSYGKLDRTAQYLNPGRQVTSQLLPSVTGDPNTGADYSKLDSCVDDDEEDKYWPPADTTEELYGQLSSKNAKEIPKNALTVNDLLGEGEFGQVFKGEWLSPTGPVEVAVKVSNNADSEERVKLLQEAAVMGQFRHARVVQLHGVVTSQEPNMVVLELVCNGALMDYLRDLNLPTPADLPHTLLRFCTEICDGLIYLSKKGFVHRDLAARNILLDKGYHCKIADFGMSRYLDEDSYYITKGGRIPLKWTAPEAILYRKYSSKSDVWSYGMVMYEIWSLGHAPFEQYSTQEVLDAFSNGFCLPPPPGCPRGIYSNMTECWNPDHHKRIELEQVMSNLRDSQDGLLCWSEEDRSVSTQTDVLGAPLEEGNSLYRDLQNMYKS